MKSQGATDQQVNQTLSPMIQEMVTTTFTTGTQQGSAASMSTSGAPAGTMSPTAMGNMTQG
jgi:hypothetical protein